MVVGVISNFSCPAPASIHISYIRWHALLEDQVAMGAQGCGGAQPPITTIRNGVPRSGMAGDRPPVKKGFPTFWVLRLMAELTQGHSIRNVWAWAVMAPR